MTLSSMRIWGILLSLFSPLAFGCLTYLAVRRRRHIDTWTASQSFRLSWEVPGSTNLLCPEGLEAILQVPLPRLHVIDEEVGSETSA